MSRGRAALVLAVEFGPQPLDVGDVDFLDVGEVGDSPCRLLHPLSDVAAQADDLDRLDVVVDGTRRGDAGRRRWATCYRTFGEQPVEIAVHDPPVRS